MRSLNVRTSFASGAVLLAAVFSAGCADKAARARNDTLTAELSVMNAQRDSLQGLVLTSSADKDRALAQVVEATKFADQVDRELRQVRELSSRVSVNRNDESGRTEAADARTDILLRLEQLRQRLATRQAQVRALLDSMKLMRADSSATATLLADLNTRLASREKEISAFQDEIIQLRAQNDRLVTDKATLTDTVKAMDVRENRIFYKVGVRRQLLNDGVVKEEGGSRGLLIVKLGKTLVPARSLDESKFTSADRRETLTIPLPRSDRAYRIVSRHDAALIEVAKREKDGSFRGEAIRILDPAKFWAPSRYLIISEK